MVDVPVLLGVVDVPVSLGVVDVPVSDGVVDVPVSAGVVELFGLPAGTTSVSSTVCNCVLSWATCC